jgi:hypothetical protein
MCLNEAYSRVRVGKHLPGIFDAFVKLRKATISFVMTVCLSVPLSVHMKKLGSHWTDFHEILHLSIFRKSVEKIQVLFQGYFT